MGPGRHPARLGDVAAFRPRSRERCDRPGSRATLGPGEIEVLSPVDGDIHQVANALSDGNSISIHVYGGNIGAMRRRRFDLASGAVSEFVSGYANRAMPNLWHSQPT